LIELPAAAAAYDARAAEYDTWYDRNAALYQAELELVDALLQPLRAVGPGLEIGAGTGRFAGPLGIDVALEPSPEMGAFARQREVQVIEGVAEELPFGRAEFGYTAFLTSLCFIPDRARALAEARRVTRPGGGIVVAFLNRASELGAQLDATKEEDPFYADASFFTPDELGEVLRAAGYTPEVWAQLHPAEKPTSSDGADTGLYCAVRARLAPGDAQGARSVASERGASPAGEAAADGDAAADGEAAGGGATADGDGS